MVKPATTARPDTSAGAHSCEWQYGHTELGGWRSSPQSLQRWNRSVPSSPDVQKNVVVVGQLGQQASGRFGHGHSSVVHGSRKVGTLPGLLRTHYFSGRSEPSVRGRRMPAQLKPTGGLEGTGVLVTGGGTGIGAACARVAAADGAAVTICGRTEATLAASVEKISGARGQRREHPLRRRRRHQRERRRAHRRRRGRAHRHARRRGRQRRWWRRRSRRSPCRTSTSSSG